MAPPPDILGFDIPVAVFSGAAALWAGALAMNDKRYAMRHTLTMLSGVSFFIATILELVASDQMFDYFLMSRYYQLNTVAVFFVMIARYLLWCILFEVVRGTSKTSEDSQLSTIPKTAYGWSTLMIIFILLYVILIMVTNTYAAIVMYYIGTYGIVMMNILQWFLSSRPGYSLAINPFSVSFRILLLILSLVSLGQIFGNVAVYVYGMGGYMALTILQYVFGSLLASMALVFVCACSSRWVSFGDHDRLNQADDNEAQPPMGTYNPDDVYTSNRTVADDVGRS